MSDHLSIEPNPRVTFRTLHEDEHVLVIEKRAGLVTQPGVGHEHDTLLNGLFTTHSKQLQNLGQKRDFGLVHRLDRETSGVLAVALSISAYEGLREQFAERQVRKFYWAISHKAPREEEGVIRKPLSEELKRTSRYTSVRSAKVGGSNAKSALTAYRVLDSSHHGALIEARPVTGRLHQIRVHLASVGAAVVGDERYASKTVGKAWPRLALHAHRLAFEHPVTGETVECKTKFPSDLKKLLAMMGLQRPDLAPKSVVSDEASGIDSEHEVARDPVGDEEA